MYINKQKLEEWEEATTNVDEKKVFELLCRGSVPNRVATTVW